MTIYRAGVNPALALHELWTTIALTMSGGEFRDHIKAKAWNPAEPWNTGRRRIMNFQFGTMWTCVEIEGFLDDQPVFSLGLRRRAYGSSESFFVLLPDGRFAFADPYGCIRRSIIAENTFLDYTWVASRRRWYVQPVHEEGHRDLTDWRRPTPYVSGSLASLNRFWTLERHETGWAMTPADAAGRAGPEIDFQKVYLHDQQLRVNRLRRAENDWRKRRGLSPQSPRTATLRTQNQTLHGDSAALAIAVLIDVNQPAKTTRLVRTRPVEAAEGIH